MPLIKEYLHKIFFSLWPPLRWELERTLNSRRSLHLLEEFLQARPDILHCAHPGLQNEETLFSINDSHADVFPSPFGVVAALKWPWASHLPGAVGCNALGTESGGAALFEDERIRRLLDKVDVTEKSVLDLGPLEGGHSYMLEKAGARVYAVEGNLRAFLKCLVVKNIYDMRAKFLLGDFVKYLESPETPKYDLIVASGVLYHMADPLSFLNVLSEKSDTVYFWTHYYNPNRKNPAISDDPETVFFKGKKILLHRQEYGDTVKNADFWGGMRPISRWMRRESILDALSALGYKVEILNDDPEHPNGSAFCLLAKRKSN